MGLEFFAGVAVVHYFEAARLGGRFTTQTADGVGCDTLTETTLAPRNEKRWVNGACGGWGES